MQVISDGICCTSEESFLELVTSVKQTYRYVKVNGYEENNVGNMSCDSTYFTCLR
jgi:hypothetical protein